MPKLKKKKIRLIIVFLLFLVAIPIIKNETRVIEKNITKYKNKINQVEKELFEAQLEYQYLSSPGVLTDKIQKYSNTNYKNLELSQIYINIENFLSEKRKQTKIIANEEKNN